MKKGKLIGIEGIDGVGKSTLAHILHDWLVQEEGINTVLTSAISHNCTIYGGRIGDLLRMDIGEKIDPVSEAMLVAAARRDNWTKIIKPALDRGDWVISDRHIDSMFAYQRDLTNDQLESLLDWAGINIRADLTFVIDLDIDNARLNYKPKDRLENRSREWWVQCRNAFFDRICINGKINDLYKFIDGNASIHSISELVIEHIKKDLLQ